MVKTNNRRKQMRRELEFEANEKQIWRIWGWKFENRDNLNLAWNELSLEAEDNENMKQRKMKTWIERELKIEPNEGKSKEKVGLQTQ